jgi:hypothetical protein
LKERKGKMPTIIKIAINGQEVEGEITHRSASDLHVKITKPYQGVTRGVHIPYIARSQKRFDSDFGDKMAKDLLKSIYHLCTFIFENMDSLLDEYLKFKKRIKFLEAKHVSEYVLKSKRLQLRKKLRGGKIDNMEYQKRLTRIRKEYKKFELKKSLTWSQFFEEYFPMIVPVNTRKDILRIIEKNIRAENKELDRSDFFIIRKKPAMTERGLLGNAYFIHPYKGQVVFVPHSHISLVISNPEKFHLKLDYIKTIYEKYDEKIGLEGMARQEILLHLIDRGFIRIRKYKNHWKVNVKELYRDTAAIFLHRWAKSIMAAADDFQIEVIVEQRNGVVIETDLATLASYEFVGRPKSRVQAMSYTPRPFLSIDEVNPGPSSPQTQ